MSCGRFSCWRAAVFALLVPQPLSAQWQSVDGGLNAQVNDFEYTADSSQLLVAGHFLYTRADSLRANGIAAWAGQQWSIDGLGGGSGDTLYVPGIFMSITLLHDTLFAGVITSHFQYHPEWGLGAGLYNDEWFSIGDPNNWFYLMKVNGRLFSGGRTDTLYGQYMPGIKEWVGGEWQAIPNMPLGPGTYYCATYWHDQYWFAGSFISGSARSVIAFDGVDQWTPNWGPGGGWINAIQGFGDSLYVGGWYPLGSDSESPMIQLWDGDAWRPFFPEVLQFHWQIRDIEVYQGALYVSGDFHFVDDPATQYSLLRFDGHELCAIGGVNTVGVNGPIAFFQGDLYMALASEFTGLEFQYIGRLPLDGLVPDRCVEATTGVAEVPPPARMRITPNPADEFITFPANGPVGSRIIRIIDAWGRTVPARTLYHEAVIRMDVSGMAPGCYIVEALRGGERRIGRFVKR